MPAYIAFLRGINVGGRGAVTMADLRTAFEAAGFEDVRTIASSGNVAFASKKASDEALSRKAEAALTKTLGRDIATHVRTLDEIRAMIAADPYQAFRVPQGWKRDVTFLREAPETELALPQRFEGSAIYAIRDRAVFSAHQPENPKGAVFMRTLEKAFGKTITTRTWDMLERLAK